MKLTPSIRIIVALLISLSFYGCSSVNIIDINPDNQALILKSEMSGLSPSQTNTHGNLQSTLEYINTKLDYGEKVFYSDTFKKFVHARFSDKFVLFDLNELNMKAATLKIQGGKSKKTTSNKVTIPALNPSKGFDIFLASGKKSNTTHLVFKVDVGSDGIKVKKAFEQLQASQVTKSKEVTDNTPNTQ